MFLDKVVATVGRSLDPSDFRELAREALLYGMRVERQPGRLKRLLRQHGCDSSDTTSTWAGTYYLLNELPRCLRDKRRKIPCLADFRFACSVLTTEQLQALFTTIENLPSVTPQEILEDLLPQIRSRAYRGRFLTMFDGMYEKGDVQQDLISKALAIMNREWGNLRSHKREDIIKYIGFCFDQKTKTYLSQTAPRAFREDFEDQSDFDRQIEANGDEDVTPWGSVELDDLRKVLTESQYRAVLLLLGEADEAETARFKGFLELQGLRLEDLREMKLKAQIARYCGDTVWEELKGSDTFRSFLQGA